MTYTITAAAPRIMRIMKLSIAAGLTSILLTGCGTSDIFGTTGQITSQLPTTPAAVKTTGAVSKVAFAPIIGAPTAVSRKLSTNLTEAAAKRHMAVITNGSEKPDYTIRGYVVAAAQKNGTKLTHIWDVADKSGKRTHRIRGEEFLAGKNSKDPWKNLSDTAISGIADKTVTKFASWLATKKPSTPKPATIPAQKIAKKTTTPAYTGSVGTAAGPMAAYIAPVVGAPGDGRTSLTNAISEQLKAKGIRIASVANAPHYLVKGNVSLTKPANGSQKIKIEWLVLDPKGKRLGVVSQKNVIPQGTLDGAWGGTAKAAASAAAQGIVKLLPSQARIN